MRKEAVFLTLLMVLTSIFLKAENKGDTVSYETQGKIIIRSGNVVKVQIVTSGVLPAIGIEGELSKHFETELLGGKFTGWMTIGQMKVIAINKNVVSFSLIKELSSVTENGLRKNQFEKGKEVKFIWQVVLNPDEAAFEKGQNILDKDVDEALRYYRDALSKNPKLDKALNMIGMIMSDKKDLDSALFYFMKACDIDPKNVMYAKNISVTYHSLKNYSKAYEYAQMAVSCNSKDIMALYLRGFTLYSLNKDKLDESTKQTVLNDLNTAIQIKPYNQFLYTRRAFFRKEFGDNSGACEDAKRAIKLGAENADSLINEYCK
jgi:tetratricopeptide (TPR) repeat protein